MTREITKAHIQQFTDNLLILAQQKGSRLRDRVMTKTITGNAAYFEQLASTEVILKTSVHAPSPNIEPEHSRRMVTIQPYHWGTPLADEDRVRMLIDPKGAYVQSASYAFGRKIDDLILDALLGDSISVSSSLPNGNNMSTVPFPTTTNQVAKDFVPSGSPANSNLTVPKLIEARRILAANDIDPDEELTCIVNASALASLLNSTTVQSIDYNSVKALVNGELDSFVGFKFIRTERIKDSGGNSSTPAHCIAFAKSGVGLAIGRDVKIRSAIRPDLCFEDYIYGEMDLGATRVEESKVVDILCVQS